MSRDLYSKFEEALSQTGCNVAPSEAHGALVGLLSGPFLVEQSKWLNCISDNLTHSNDSLLISHNTDLDFFIKLAADALQCMEIDGMIIIPDDDVALGDRIAAFSAWCIGFLYGFGISGVSGKTMLSVDSQEFLSHLTQFCRIDLETENGEENEKALFELLEFSKIGILNLNEEAQKLSPIDTEVTSLH